MLKYLMNGCLFMVLMDKAGEPPAGGAPPDNSKDLEALKSQNADLMKRLEALEGKKPDPKEDPDLAEKARKEREAGEKSATHEKSLTAAIEFNASSKDFVKLNQSLIPKSIESIFAQAEKEKYDSAIDKSNAIKAGIISEFFAVQTNYDLLTGPQKNELDVFLKLTKNGKQERVENIYSMIFEPTLESIRKIEKAKQLNNGSKDQSDGEKALADRMMKLSKKHYLGVKDA